MYGCNAQTITDTSRAIQHRSVGRMLRDDVRFRLPPLEMTYSIPVKNKSFLGLPYGLDKFMYNIQPGPCSILTYANDFRLRLAALYYKDRVGVEWYFGGFGGGVNVDDFNNYLNARFPGYTLGPINYLPPSLSFFGQRFGLAYKMHLKKYVIEPKAQYGFETLSLAPYNYRLKENGSNQFIEYQVSQQQTDKNGHSYHAELNLARRFFIKPGPHFIEAGVRGEYLYSPYALRFTMTQQPYGAPATINTLDWKGNFSAWEFGLYAAYFIRK